MLLEARDGSWGESGTAGPSYINSLNRFEFSTDLVLFSTSDIDFGSVIKKNYVLENIFQ